MTMAAAGCKQGIILDRLWTAHLLLRPKEPKETITLKFKTEKGQKKKKRKRGKLSPDFRENGLSSGYYLNKNKDTRPPAELKSRIHIHLGGEGLGCCYLRLVHRHFRLPRRCSFSSSPP